jgi:hypothetical protein
MTDVLTQNARNLQSHVVSAYSAMSAWIVVAL